MAETCLSHYFFYLSHLLGRHLSLVLWAGGGGKRRRQGQRREEAGLSL